MPLEIRNSQTAGVFRNLSRNNTQASKTGGALSTGIKSDLSVVDRNTTNKTSFKSAVLGVANTNISDYYAMFRIMDDSLTGMRTTLGKMREAVISAAGKSSDARRDITNTLESFIELFNSQLEETKFKNRYLLGAENFASNMRDGELPGSIFALEVDAINPIFGQRKAVKHFATAINGGPAVIAKRQMVAAGLGNLLAVTNAIAYEAAMGQDNDDVAQKIIDEIKKIVQSDPDKLSKEGGVIGGSVIKALTPYKNKVFNPGGAAIQIDYLDHATGITKQKNINNPDCSGGGNSTATRILICNHAFEVATESLGLKLNDLTAVNQAITYAAAMDASPNAGTVINSTFNTMKAQINGITAAGDTKVGGGYIGEMVKEMDTTNSGTGQIPGNPGGLGAVDNDKEKMRLKLTYEALAKANAAAKKVAIKEATEAIVDSVYGSHDSDLAEAIFEITDQVAELGGATADGPKQSAEAIFHAIREIRDGEAPSRQELNTKEHIERINTIIKSGPRGIETAIIAATASHAAANGLSAENAGDGVNQFSLGRDDSDHEEVIKETEKSLRILERKLDRTATEVGAYIEAIRSRSGSIDEKIMILDETTAAFSAADIIDEAQRFQKYLTSTKLSLSILQSYGLIVNSKMDNVEETLVRGNSTPSKAAPAA